MSRMPSRDREDRMPDPADDAFEDHVIPIAGCDFWVKTIEMLQQNWALIEIGEAGSALVHFISDTGGVFDMLRFDGQAQAEIALRRNGFRRFASNGRLQAMLTPPIPPYVAQAHPNGPIYSSGRFWIGPGR
jgi:hypothetical protein